MEFKPDKIITELYCHNCSRYIQYELDASINGEHVIICPNCGHEHFRYVENGIVTDRRYGSSNIITHVTVLSVSSVSSTTSDSAYFISMMTSTSTAYA